MPVASQGQSPPISGFQWLGSDLLLSNVLSCKLGFISCKWKRKKLFDLFPLRLLIIRANNRQKAKGTHLNCEPALSRNLSVTFTGKAQTENRHLTPRCCSRGSHRAGHGGPKRHAAP